MAYVPDEAIENSYELSHAAFRLFVVYCKYRNRESGKAWPSFRTIQQKTGIHFSYIPELRQQLVEKHWIEIDTDGDINLLKGFKAPRSDSSRSDESNADCSDEQNNHSDSPNKKRSDEQNTANQCSDDSSECSDSSTKCSDDSTAINKESSEPIIEPVKEPEEAWAANLSREEKISLRILMDCKQYPFDYEKDLAQIRKLVLDFERLNVYEQFPLLTDWLLDHKKTLKKPRLFLRRWMETAVRIQQRNGNGTGKETNAARNQNAQGQSASGRSEQTATGKTTIRIRET